MSDFDDFLAPFDRWVGGQVKKAGRGLVAGAARLEARAKSTRAYQDDTGATRAGTVAYVVGESDERFTEAIAAVLDKNPLEIASEELPGPEPGVGRIVLTVPLTYTVLLELARAGANGFLFVSLYHEVGGIFEDTCRALGDGSP